VVSSNSRKEQNGYALSEQNQPFLTSHILTLSSNDPDTIKFDRGL